MKVRRAVLKARTITLLAGTMAIVFGSATAAGAGDLDPNSAASYTGWYFHGSLQAGGRFYIDRPDSGFGYNANGSFLLPSQTESRAKYQEYGEIKPGAFLDWINLVGGSNDGRYAYNFLGEDVGYNAQSYKFDFSEAGKQYLSLGWDQSPHLYSTSAKSLFGGVGTTNLWVNNNVQDALQAQWAAASGSNAAGLTARRTINGIINRNASHIDEIGIDRDTFSVHYRITPTPDWDFNVGYSHLDRTGTQPGSLNYTYGRGNAGTGSFPSNIISMPIPVDDTTQRPEGSGEYSGVGPWGKFNIKLAYNGSIYTDNLTVLTADNPYSNTGFQMNYGTLRLPLPPSNQAHAFTASGATDIPFFDSRFTTTNQFSRWTQNAPFVGTANNGIPADPLPAASLDGEVRNFLTNNVLTSKLTDTLDNKIRVRYYQHVNHSPKLDFGQQVLADSEMQDFEADEYNSFWKTNVNEDLTWRPTRWFTLGAGYGYENWARAGNEFHSTQTYENIGKMFARVQLTKWAQWRVSYSYGARRHDDDYFFGDEFWTNARWMDLADRDQQRARTLLDVDVTDTISITPNAGLRWDDYPETSFNQLGVSSVHNWNAGVDVGWLATPTLRLTAGYNYQQGKLDMSAAVGNAGGPCPFPGGAGQGVMPLPVVCTWHDNLTQEFNTVLASANWDAIPSKLNIRLNYIASWESESHDFTPCSGAGFTRCNGIAVSGAGVTPAQVGLPWPENTNFYQRFDATARYYFDQDTVRMLGWKGRVTAKLRYTYEHNEGSFWQADAVNAYFGTITGNNELTAASRSTWLAYNNPNYTTQLIAASLIFEW